MRAGGCPAVVAQWLKPEMSWVRLPATAGFFSFLYFRLITSEFIYGKAQVASQDKVCVVTEVSTFLIITQVSSGLKNYLHLR